ncbi:acyl--CoA ligase [Rhodococcus sp. 05-340-1]|uniref:class I adenylate-forming enzyme family protein n=1 Tax=unclassified Rhodococcus (in: high G+C Gram-positive bacteria) TaxID=192944 RepID=UPI000B9A9C7B|nr:MULTISPECIES: AMP-binding protein [unclassified Rhodococcus (in: high G+C Gram-positive bacteria)]OZD71124.1 acyl--CoA ligase [Rhodococcus sp. 05-340-2]OZD74069.1 acyl--CoA ligase [Rhodococcus sp. 05-340-1]
MTTGIEDRRSALMSEHPEWTPRTLDGWLDECADRYRHRPLVLTEEVTYSYSDVAEQSRRLADGLASLGVQRGDRVGLLMANHPEFVPLKFAIARVGAIAIPFNYLYRQNELEYVLQQSECRVLITMNAYSTLDYVAMLDEIAPGWDSLSFATRPDSAADAVPALRSVVVLETGGTRRVSAMTVADLSGLGIENADAAAGHGADPTDIGDMLYTSGTTGSPKGVLVTHDAVLRTGYASALTRAYEDGRRILFSLPCYHMFGYVEGLLSVMFVGGAIVPQTSFSPVGYLAGIERFGATDILCVPTMAVAIVEHPDRHKYDLRSLTAILCGSAPAPVWLWEKVEREFGVSEIVTGYGMTECGGAMTLTLPEDPLSLTSDTVGRPKLAGAASIEGSDSLVVYRTVDPLTGELQPNGSEGELVSSGPSTMMGYWNKPEETAAALRGGWLHSGDLGLVRDDGYLQVTGRSKELYKSGGELVMPKEIEDLLAAHEGISQVFAIGLLDDRWGEIGCAVVVRAPGSTVTAAELIELCRSNLARFKVPKKVVFLDAEELPTTPTGKVQKFRLVQLATAAAAQSMEGSGV